jgi:hypothetical protein
MQSRQLRRKQLQQLINSCFLLTGTLVVPLMGTSLPKLIFNHPFLFFLRNTETGDILFAGRMSEPEAAKQPVSGSLTDSQLSELTQGIFTQKPVARPGVPAVPSNTYNPASSSSNTYRLVPLPSGTLNTNSNLPVPQTQHTVTSYYSSPKNLNTGNVPASAPYQSYPTPLQIRSVGNYQSQPNAAEYQPNGNTEEFHASNPDTIGTQYGQAPTQFLSASGSYASATVSAKYPSAVNESPQGDGVTNTDRSYNDRIHFSP